MGKSCQRHPRLTTKISALAGNIPVHRAPTPTAGGLAPGLKIARILRAMVKHRRPYDSSRLGNPEQPRARKERYLRHQAEQLGFALTPLHAEVS